MIESLNEVAKHRLFPVIDSSTFVMAFQAIKIKLRPEKVGKSEQAMIKSLGHFINGLIK